MERFLRGIIIGAAMAGTLPIPAAAQQPAGPIQLPTVTVTAQKEPADAQTLPVSLTTASKDTIDAAGLDVVSDAAIYAPNTYFSDFTARKLTNPRFRGVGSSPANPGVATYIDGVPQLNANSSSLDLLDVGQIEFARGPQSALFGRNALGGLINITSVRPSLSGWTGTVAVPLGSFGERAVRGNASGPLGSGKVGVGVAFDYGRRDGFTRNLQTGRDVDSRDGFAGKGQLLWAPGGAWQARLIFAGERDRDGDYALNDLSAVRQNPFTVARDFDGHTDRNVFSTTFQAQRTGPRIGLSTTTGVVRWTTRDVTDLDYSPVPLLTRDNAEKAVQFTEEIRLFSAPRAPLTLSNGAAIAWQAGAMFFTQSYDQDAVNGFAPYVLSPFLAFPVAQHSPQATLDDVGVGIYGQATTTIGRIDLSAGARLDHEQKQAVLKTFFSPAVAAGSDVDTDKSFTDVSPQVAVAYRLQPEHLLYASLSRGFKAGGFNPASPLGLEAYDEEHAWHAEGGLKASLAGGRVAAQAAVFYIDWQDMQLNLPNPGVPGQFYISNVGGASSTGVEFQVNARPQKGVDLFGALGVDRARFGEGSLSSGANVSDKKLPNTPDYNASIGVQLSREVRPNVSIYARAEAVAYGAFQYDDANTAGQDSYGLTNFRFGFRHKNMSIETWVRNAFDTRYVPVAFAYPGLARSGFVGEPGRPRTWGITLGVKF